MDTLNRGPAPFPAEIWKAIDEAAANAARDRLTGRRFLDLEGPFGVGLTAIEVGNDDYCRQPGPDEAGAVMGRAIPLPMIRKSSASSRRMPGPPQRLTRDNARSPPSFRMPLTPR